MSVILLVSTLGIVVVAASVILFSVQVEAQPAMNSKAEMREHHGSMHDDDIDEHHRSMHGESFDEHYGRMMESQQGASCHGQEQIQG
ncbi:MAG: hypothetical protein HYU39_03685 [Thaumarchaeota archaeon]|nr:hypothetical protein [Nitrososphaerota archaeon]